MLRNDDAFYFNFEETLVVVNEVFEQVVDVDLLNCDLRQLGNEANVIFTLHGEEWVLLPVVLKEVFDFGD